MKELNISIPQYVAEIISLLESGGFEAYVVGGCVRDSLLGVLAHDWDVCSSALPEEVQRQLCGFKVIETGIAHGTVTAVKNGEICEITTFRNDGDYTDHRRPDSVSYTKNIENDLKRRDFTINAMAYSPVRGMIDLFDGEKDLSKRVIRCVGDPEKRFDEDALRIMRALRFSSTLGFSIEEKTADAMLAGAGLLQYIARERINSELSGILCGANVSDILIKCRQIFKELFGDFLVSDSWNVIAETVGRAHPNLILRLSLLLDLVPLPDAINFLHELRFDKKTISGVSFLLKNRDFTPACNDISLKKMLSEFGIENSRMLVQSKIAKEPKNIDLKSICDTMETIIKNPPPLRIEELEINGNDLMKLGIPEGKKIREILMFALDSVLSGKVPNDRTELLQYLVTNKNKNIFKDI